MSIDYVKRTRTTTPTVTAPTAGCESRVKVGGPIGLDLAYWVRQYRALTAQIQTAEVTNHDRYRKEQVNVRELYSRRAAAAARMADLAEQLVGV